MIKTIKASKSEKILFIFLIVLSIFVFTSFFLLKNKCLFVEKNNLSKLNFDEPNNIAVMNVECGNVIIELYPDISPKAVERLIIEITSISAFSIFIFLSIAIFWYHILTGIRHLVMDFFHIGESLNGSYYSSIFTIVLWIATSLVFFGYLFI